jgi:hypothetical protein
VHHVLPLLARQRAPTSSASAKVYIEDPLKEMASLYFSFLMLLFPAMRRPLTSYGAAV